MACGDAWHPWQCVLARTICLPQCHTQVFDPGRARGSMRVISATGCGGCPGFLLQVGPLCMPRGAAPPIATVLLSAHGQFRLLRKRQHIVARRPSNQPTRLVLTLNPRYSTARPTLLRRVSICVQEWERVHRYTVRPMPHRTSTSPRSSRCAMVCGASRVFRFAG